MPGSATLYIEQAVLGHTLGFQAFTMPPGAFIALCAVTPAPTSTTRGAEVASGGYARQQATFALTSGTSNLAANTATISFPAATTPWGALGFFEIWDAVTAGNRLYWGPLVDPSDGITPITRNILAGDIVRFAAGVIDVQAT